jgi:hypothetical protein
MMKWLYRIIARIDGCRHKWTIIKETNIVDPLLNLQVPVGVRYTLQCAKCGDIKFKRTP